MNYESHVGLGILRMTPKDKRKRLFREMAILAFQVIVFVAFLFFVTAKLLLQNVAHQEQTLDLAFGRENVIHTAVALLAVIGLAILVYFIIKKRSRPDR